MLCVPKVVKLYFFIIALFMLLKKCVAHYNVDFQSRVEHVVASGVESIKKRRTTEL